MLASKLFLLKKSTLLTAFFLVFLPSIVSASVVTWDGNGADNNWSTALNWSSGTVPGTGDTVIFDSTSTKNCTINVNISIVGITINSGYTGIITQASGKTITIGSGSWVQNDGTFMGGDSAITINSLFDLNGGTFTSTTGLLTNNTTANTTVFDIATTATFNHNNGNVKFTGGNHFAIDTHNSSLFNVEINKCGTCGSSGRIDVDGDLVLTSANNTSLDITLAGNLSGTAVMIHSGANGKVTFDGAGNQTSTFTGRLPNVTVNKASGTLTFANDFAISNKFTYLAGNVVFTGTTVSFTHGDHWSIDSGNVEFNNVIVNKCPSCDMTVVGTMKVGGDFTLTQNQAFNTGTIEIKGNLTSTDTASSGSATIVLTGTNDQVVTVGSNDLPNGTFTINKASGKVSLGDNLTLNGTGQDLFVTSGTLDLAGHNLSVTDNITVTSKLKLKGNESITDTTFSLNNSTSTVEYYDDTVSADLSKLPPSVFYNLILGANKTHNFEVGSSNEITVNGDFSSQGAINSKSILRSLTPGSQWYIKVIGTESINDNVDVQDSNANNGITIDGGYSNDSGNNSHWLFSAPYITNVTSTNANGSYNQGNTIAIKITFNEAVIVTGSPTLTLETGATDRSATYSSGSSTNELTFNYTAQIGDATADLDYISTSALSLNGGTIKKGSYTNAILTLPAPGAANSLSANKNLVIYTFNANAQSVSLNEDVSTNITLTSNYAGVNTLTYAIVTPPAHGTLVLSSGAIYTYTPSANYNGSDSFIFKAIEGSQDSTTATVTLTIAAVNDAPTAVTDTYSAVQNVPVTYDVLSNDSDLEGSSLTITAVSTPAHGTAEIIAGKIRYTATAGYSGSDSFNYTISDGSLTTTMTDNIVVYLTAGTVTWNGCGTDNNWSTPANWSGGTVPLTTDMVIFDNTSVKNCSIDSNINLKGITIAGIYTGTITQNADKTVTIGTSNWNQSNGNFIGSNASITVSGNFIVSGGTFTSTSGNLTLSGGEITVTSSFTHNNGTITKSGGYATWNITSPIQNLVINTMGTFTTTHLHALGNITALAWNAHAGEMIVEGNYTTQFSSQSTSTGKIIFKGSSNQLLSANGGIGCLSGVEINKSGGVLTIQDTLKMPLGLAWVSGTVVATGSTVIFNGGSQTVDAAGINFNHVEFNTAGNITLPRPLKVDGNLIVTSINWLEPERIEVKGNLSVSDTFFWGNGVEIHLVGTNNQVINIAGAAGLRKSIIINKPSGIVSLGSNLNLSLAWQNINIVNGTFDLNGYNLSLGGTLKNSGLVQLIGSETVSLGDLDCSGQGTVSYTGTGTYASLVLGDNYYHLNLAGNLSQTGQISVFGNLNITGSLNSNGFNLYLGGNFNNSGTYTSGTNSVYLIGKHQVITGNNTFHNLSKRNNTSASLTFPAGGTQTITGTLELVGTNGDLLELKSSNVGSTWTINHTGTISRLGYLNVKDSTSISVLDAKGNSLDAGNNVNWVFTGSNSLVWTGATNNNFSNAGNWQGLVAPTANDVVEFLSGTSAVSIDIDANVAGVILGTGFSGSVTMATNKTLTVGFNGITVAGGTFNGNTKKLTNSGDLSVSGGLFDSVGSDVEILGSVQISGGTLKSSTYSFEVGGNWTKTGGTFDALGAIKFNGFGGQSITAGGTDSNSDFDNITVDFGTITLASPIKIDGNLTINSGQVKSSTTIYLTGNLSNNSGFINDQTNALWVLNGTDAQTVKLQNHSLKNIQVSNVANSVTFLDEIVANELIGDAGSNIFIEKGKLVQLTKLTLNGTANSLVKLKSNIAQQNAYFIVSGQQTLSYVEARGINAQFGPTLNGSNNCVDLGYNVNWVFPDNSGKPVISFAPASDVFENNASITLTSTGTSPVIHYTLDGSTPTETSAVYSAPINLAATTTIKAISIDGANTSIVFGKVYTAVQSAIDDGLIYPVKSYGLGGIVYLGESKRFEGQAWHVGADGVMNTPDDYRVPEFDKYIAWSATQGTIEKIAGTGGAVFTGNGSSNYYTVTLTLGPKSFTGCNNSMPVTESGHGDVMFGMPDSSNNPMPSPIEDYAYRCLSDKSPTILATKGKPVILNVVRKAGFYNLVPFSLGRSSRMSGFNEIKVISSTRVLLLNINSNNGGWFPYDLNSTGKFYRVGGDAGYIEKIIVGNVVIGYKYFAPDGTTWIFEKVIGTNQFRITEVIDSYGNRIFYDYISNNYMVITDASGNIYEVYADTVIEGINQISKIVIRPFGSILYRTWYYTYDIYGFLDSERFEDINNPISNCEFKFGTDIHGNPNMFQNCDGCQSIITYDDVWRVKSYYNALGEYITNYYSGKNGAYYVQVINSNGHVSYFYRNQTPYRMVTTRYIDYNGLNNYYNYNLYGYITEWRYQELLNGPYFIHNYFYDIYYYWTQDVFDPTGLNQVTSYEHDIHGNIITYINPILGEIHYTFNNQNSMESSTIIDAQNQAIYTSYIYNSSGKLIEKIDPIGAHTFYEYDDFGNLIREINSSGDTSNYNYNVWRGRIPLSTGGTEFDYLGNNSKENAWDITSYIKNGNLRISNLNSSWAKNWFKFTISAPATINFDILLYGAGNYPSDVFGNHNFIEYYVENSSGTYIAGNSKGTEVYYLDYDYNLTTTLPIGTYYIVERGTKYQDRFDLNLSFNFIGNQPPEAFNQQVRVFESDSTSITLTGNDPETHGLTYTIVTGPLHGTLSGSGNNQVYTPTINYNGDDFFTFTVSDGTFVSSPATINITVVSVNNTPVANPDVKSILDNNAVSFNPLENDSDVDGDTLAVLNSFSTAKGTISLVNNTITYTPSLTKFGNDTFTYTVSDGNGGISIGQITIFRNMSPIANPDTMELYEDSLGSVIPHMNDTDIDDNNFSLSITNVTNGSKGIAWKSGLLVFYKPNANLNGDDIIYYTITDGKGGFSTSSITIHIKPVIDNLIAGPDTITTNEDTPISFNPVSSNDSSVDGYSLSITSITTNTLKGTASYLDNVVTYTPKQDVSGADTLIYNISDGHGGTASAAITINITQINDKPIAKDISIAMNNSGAKTIDVIAQAFDVEVDALTISTFSSPSHGSVQIVSNKLVFTPESNYVGSDSFTYAVSDGQLTSDTKTISILISDPASIVSFSFGENQAVITQNQSINSTIAISLPASFELNNLIANFVVSEGANVYLGSNKIISGFTKFNYGIPLVLRVVSENGLITKYYDLTITIIQGPYLKSQFYNLNQGADLNIDLKSLVINFNENLAYSFELVEQPLTGTTSLNGNNLIYHNTVSGLYTIKVKATENSLISNTAILTVSMLQSAVKPTLSNGSIAVSAGQSGSINLQSLISNYSSNSIYTYKIFGNNRALGIVSISGSSLTYSANIGAKGVDKVEFLVSVGNTSSKIGIVVVDVDGGLSLPVTLKFNKTGEGTITSNYSGVVNYNSAVSMTAVPAANWVFKEWTGNLNPADLLSSTLNFNIINDVSVVAQFVPSDDMDIDGMSDIWESQNGGDLNPVKDDDNDGINNLNEFKYQTNPQAIDSNVSFENDKVNLPEGTSAYAIKLIFNPALTANAAIYLKTTSTSAILGVDYVLTESGTLSLNTGLTEKIIYLDIPSDAKVEPTQNVKITISQFKGIFPGSKISFDLYILDQSNGLDSDKDGMLDSWEVTNFGDLTRDGKGDLDNDGLTDLQEFRYKSNPAKTDTEVDKTNFNLGLKCGHVEEE